jgi:arginyl-tRNA synthetase
VIAAELRRAILAAASSAGANAAPSADPLLRPGPAPGSYASSLPFRLAPRDPRGLAAAIAARLEAEPWIASARLTGPGYLTVTVTEQALADLAPRIARAGPACARSDALADRTVPAPPEPELAAAPGWPAARGALAAHLTARLAAAAGATLIFDYPERPVVPLPEAPAPPPASRGPGVVARAIEYAGADAVRFALARMPPGGTAPDPGAIARHVLDNPAYAVRYAHAAAAAVLRSSGSRQAGPPGPWLKGSGELDLLDALSWLPERVAVAARRGRPDEFARYLEGLAARTIDIMSRKLSSERLWLADAARTGLASGLGLLGVDAPERL